MTYSIDKLIMWLIDDNCHFHLFLTDCKKIYLYTFQVSSENLPTLVVRFPLSYFGLYLFQNFRTLWLDHGERFCCEFYFFRPYVSTYLTTTGNCYRVLSTDNLNICVQYVYVLCVVVVFSELYLCLVINNFICLLLFCLLCQQCRISICFNNKNYQYWELRDPDIFYIPLQAP